MKKIFLTAALMAGFASAHAQAVVTGEPEPRSNMPQPRDWSIGFDAVPIIRTVGNLFHNPSGNDSVYSEQQFTLVGLCVKNETTAMRMKLRLGFGSARFNNLVLNDANTTSQLTDTWTEDYMRIAIGGGIQKWRGKGKLKGLYGAEALLILGTHSHTFTYGNPFTATIQTPTTTDFSDPLPGGGFNSAAAGSRMLEVNDGTTWGVNIAAFIGAEYFFAPKMSLSAEYGWGLTYLSGGEASRTDETWTGGSGGALSNIQTKIASSSLFIVDVEDAASIILHLYF